MSTTFGRRCTKCEQTKPFTEFSKSPTGRNGLKSSCKSCDAARHRTLHPPQPRKPNPVRRPPIEPESIRTCTRCREEKPHSEFSLSRAATATSNAVYRSQCKTCQAEQARSWYANNLERAQENRRRFNLSNIYGMTVAEYDAILAKQGNVCAICGNGEPGAHGRTRKQFRLSVDHCHDTGRVRGLLCQRCNRAIGLLGDDPVVLRKAITYLLRGREVTNLGGQ